jgi:hypothetical protein
VLLQEKFAALYRRASSMQGIARVRACSALFMVEQPLLKMDTCGCGAEAAC